jgi:xanthine dehydrogenase molybdenum-binding subunit
MIPFEFEYYRPDTIEEAVNAFEELELSGRHPIYYAGGTEIISMARRSHLSTDAVIDIKQIPEGNVFSIRNGSLISGAAITLTQISEENLFPLLSEASRGVADHTIRNKITLGGNICGRIIYREAVLPFLLCNSTAVIAGKKGSLQLPLLEAFDQKLKLEKGEFLVQLVTDRSFLDLPHVSIKKTRQEEIDYPLITVSALRKDRLVRMAFSGVLPYPFRSLMVEDILNDQSLSMASRIDQAIGSLPGPVMGGLSGSPEYRTFVLKNTIYEIMTELGGQ